MSKIISKGTIMKQTVSMSLAVVAQITDISFSGAETETFDATTLDTSGAGKEYAPTGYAEGGSCAVDLFYDPGLAGHQDITDGITTPAETDWEVTWSDTTAMAFTAAGVGVDITAAMADGLKASVNLKLDQLAVFPT